MEYILFEDIQGNDIIELFMSLGHYLAIIRLECQT